MKPCISSIYGFVLIAVWMFCSSAQFLGGEEVADISRDPLDEASGLCASWRTDGVLWTHNDRGSGDGPTIYAITTDGDYLGAYDLDIDFHLDFEDIAIGPGPDPSVPYLYIADIGNNDYNGGSRSSVRILRVKEPPAPFDESRETLGGVDIITLTYPEGETEFMDAEALMIDPVLGELYILRKAPLTTPIYATPKGTIGRPGSFSMMLEYRGFIGVEWITAGDVSRSGGEILIKSTSEVYYFQRNEHYTIADALRHQPSTELDYDREYQGEAICFAYDLSGYYTLSETAGRRSAPLFFYPRAARTPYPTNEPTPKPTNEPTLDPTRNPTPLPTPQPTEKPTLSSTRAFSITSFSITIPQQPPPPPSSAPTIFPVQPIGNETAASGLVNATRVPTNETTFEYFGMNATGEDISVSRFSIRGEDNDPPT